MALRRVPFSPGEWYHCYNRGVEGRRTFLSNKDYERFVESLYLCNDVELVPRYNIKHQTYAEILSTERKGSLVDVGAYCMMPNHFHLLLRERAEGGISKFMHRLVTSYTMYFNIKHEHIGGLFVKPFRAKHISNDRYLRRVAEYIHLNPVELYEPGWKLGAVCTTAELHKRLNEYPYSSLSSYVSHRLETRVLDPDAIALIRGNGSILHAVGLLKDREAYYASI